MAVVVEWPQVKTFHKRSQVNHGTAETCRMPCYSCYQKILATQCLKCIAEERAYMEMALARSCKMRKYLWGANGWTTIDYRHLETSIDKDSDTPRLRSLPYSPTMSCTSLRVPRVLLQDEVLCRATHLEVWRHPFTFWGSIKQRSCTRASTSTSRIRLCSLKTNKHLSI